MAVLPTGEGRNRWAFIRGGILAVIGLLVAAGAGVVVELLEFIWPAALVAAGIYLLWCALRGSWPHRR